MTVETFRYLFSALIQVFGTIIAVNAIFLILKHDSNIKRLEILKKKLTMDALSWGRGALDYTKDFDRLEKLEMPAIYISTYPDDKFRNYIRTKKENISSSIKHQEAEMGKDDVNEEWRRRAHSQAKKHREALEMLESHEEQYLNLLNRIKNFFKLVIKTMSVPAFLAILFSFGLLFTENISCLGFLTSVAIFAISLSAIGFAIIISLAAKTFKE